MPDILDDRFQSIINDRAKLLSYDEDRYVHLDRPGILEYLNKLGYSATRSTLSRYYQLGLMMLPENRKSRAGVKGRTFYHPLSVIEYMAAYLLFKGSWQEIGSKDLRIPRLTADDVFFGRLLYYRCREFPSGLAGLGFDKYRFDISVNKEFIASEQCLAETCCTMGDGIILMSDIQNLDLIDPSLSRYIKKYDMGEEASTKFGMAYSVYTRLIYQTTFNALFEQHIEEILDRSRFSEIIR